MPLSVQNFENSLCYFDSVVLFAKALNKIIRDCMTKNENCDIGKLARNGKLITQTIIKMGKYESISGSVVKIDKEGNSVYYACIGGQDSVLYKNSHDNWMVRKLSI